MSIPIKTTLSSPAITAALDDLHRDLTTVLPNTPDLERWTMNIERTDTLAPETFILEVTTDNRISITASDDLGTIYGIYEFSHRILGIDPLWFWKAITPPPLASFAPAPQRIESLAPAFRYRGWFINDEDLLCRWKESGNSRFTDWPKREQTLKLPLVEEHNERRLLDCYTPVVAPEVMEKVFETLLRLGGNLIIPGSFIDVFNEPEAAIIRAAARRGLFVSQHHVEPLGVSHFGYETWWGRRGKSPTFSYREDPQSMHECWKAYAERWNALAGDRIIWQTGLRGRGDRPLWHHDPHARERAGEFISSALADQMNIIRTVDPRPAPPATLTLWLEGAELMKDGKLDVPAEVIYVFTDHPLTQEMQEDFQKVPRTPERRRGFYYHVAVWCAGPHLAQGPTPGKISRTVNEVRAKGDTAYAILNVSNVREHLMGIAVWMRQVWNPSPVSTDYFLSEWCPNGTTPLYRRLLDAIPVREDWSLYDGSARLLIERLLSASETGRPPDDIFKLFAIFEPFEKERQRTQSVLRTACVALEGILQEAPDIIASLPPDEANFVTANLVVHATILRGLYAAVDALLESAPRYPEAATALQSILDAYPGAETGRWKHWYRGDTKMGIARLLTRIHALH
ncbi:glycosyl hydrolase 115 family protein [Geminisphaera colitermitum]|uniref:glycosyl hydrolase 115 family protein n=1 Tax=Geminisphaera colitermitum TaxID=1148786 RepID=UPI000158D15B|nr:glycosyl hydrolase 115 family protein [Geminisphaera colitermitum]